MATKFGCVVGHENEGVETEEWGDVAIVSIRHQCPVRWQYPLLNGDGPQVDLPLVLHHAAFLVNLRDAANVLASLHLSHDLDKLRAFVDLLDEVFPSGLELKDLYQKVRVLRLKRDALEWGGRELGLLQTTPFHGFPLIPVPPGLREIICPTVDRLQLLGCQRSDHQAVVEVFGFSFPSLSTKLFSYGGRAS